jgi:hypothetical protein
MKRILSLGSVAAVVLAFGLTGCDGGGSVSEGVPQDVKGYVPLEVNGKTVSTDMTKIGIKPPPIEGSKGVGGGVAPVAK